MSKTDKNKIVACQAGFRFRVLRLTGVVLRPAVSIILLLLVLRSLDWEQLKNLLSSTWLSLLGLATIILIFRVFAAAYRWHRLLLASGHNIAVYKLACWYYIASFFNLFLPTAIGGDIVRMYELTRHGVQNSTSIASVLVERMTGFAGMLFFALPVLLFHSELGSDSRVYWGVAAIAMLFISATVMLFWPPFLKFIEKIIHRCRLEKLSAYVAKVQSAMAIFSKNRMVLVQVMLITLIFHLIGIFCAYLTGLALGIDLSFYFYLIVIPIVWLLTMLPLSVNGIGLREWSFVLFFSAAGVTDTTALTYSFLTFIQLMIIGLCGGVVFAFTPGSSCFNHTTEGKKEND